MRMKVGLYLYVSVSNKAAQGKSAAVITERKLWLGQERGS